jgi:hypothetical protein
MIFYEFSLLKHHTSAPFNYLNQIIESPDQKKDITPFGLMMILKGIAKVSGDRRKFSDFAYKVCTVLEKDVPNLSLLQ